jgi:hypothetical protein
MISRPDLFKKFHHHAKPSLRQLQQTGYFLQLGIVLFFVFMTLVSAHAFIVTGSLVTIPNPAKANQPFTLQLDMHDPNLVPVEDAVVLADFSREGQTQVLSFNFTQIEPGLYNADVTLPDEGVYTLLLRDQTYAAEEAKATLQFTLGSPDAISFIFPPTRTSTNNLQAWLIWVVGLPVLAGIIVTVLVLRNTRKTETEEKL